MGDASASRFLGDKNRQAQQDALATRARQVDAEAARERDATSPEERAHAAARYWMARAAHRPPDSASHSEWQSFFLRYPNPYLLDRLAYEDEHGPPDPLWTPAEVSLGRVLDSLPDDSSWLGPLTRADEWGGRVLGDGLRLQRWSRVLVDMHFSDVEPLERCDLAWRYFREVWAVYQRMLAAQLRAA